ncbi:MAG TPA: Rrf2 family transcriptional regulator [Vicinamibacterales bacterium]|nr:Rrf2 family transcriptional regulator [Vicinamibacterales bacterium]
MLTRKGKYGLKAMILLAREHGTGPILIGDLAEKEAIPKKFLENILLTLKHRGLVYSRKGPHGGYQLAREAEKISVGEIVRALDGPLALVSCVSQTAYAPCEECVTEHECAVRRVFQQVRDETARILDGTTLAEAADEFSRGEPKRIAPRTGSELQ